MEMKSREDIYKDMVMMLSVHLGSSVDINPNGVLSQVFYIMADQLYTVQQQIYNLANTPTHPLYTYPDGTKSMTRPKDGAKFDQRSTNSIDHWTWDDVKEQWFRTGTTLKIQNPIEFAPVHLELSSLGEQKCECGSEATGSNRHSTWCQKFPHEL